MKKKIAKPGLYLRTAYFIDNLRAVTNLSFSKLDERIRKNQYEHLGLTGPSEETVRDYFRLYRSPVIDPRDGTTPPWLMAVESEIQGSAYAFFHPIFDLLFGQLELSAKWKERLQRIPEEWILYLEARGDGDKAEEWRSFNAALKVKRGRKPKQPTQDRLSFIHLTLMRLPDPIFSILFNRTGLAITHARTYLPITDEIELLLQHRSMDGLAALIGLVLEAAEIGHMDRFHQARQAVAQQLNILDEIPACRRMGDRLKRIIVDFCLSTPARRYNSTLYYGFGLPATWRVNKLPSSTDANSTHDQ